MRDTNPHLFALGVFFVGLVVATYVSYLDRQKLVDDGCVMFGKPGQDTTIAKGVKIVGTVWICDEDRKKNKVNHDNR